MKDPDYSFLEEAAAEARRESRKHWAKGGEADKKYPTHWSGHWRIPLVDNTIDASIRRMKGKKIWEA
jgi:hypothetical protein